MNDIKFTVIKKLNSHKGKVLSTTWEEFVNYIISDGHEVTSTKNKRIPFFSMSEFRGGRKTKHIKRVYGLILDIDGSFNIGDTQKQLEDFEYLMYSTYSHKMEKNIDKIRVILPFNTPYMLTEVTRRVNLLKRIFHYSDPSSFNATQFQALPNCPSSRRKYAFIKRNLGKKFNLSKLPSDQFLTDIEKDTARKSQNIKQIIPKTNYISPNTVVRFRDGAILARKINRHIHNVLCPTHQDSKPSEFADVNSFGVPYIHCKHCGTIWVDMEGYDPKSDMPFQLLKSKHEQHQTEVESLHSQSTIYQLLKKIIDNLSLHNVIYGAEGTGKSHLAKILCNAKKSLIFACHSNRQAEEKYRDFTEAGLNPFLLTSRSYEIEKTFGIRPVVHPKKHPWDLGRLDKVATLNLIREKNPNLTEDALTRIPFEHSSNTHPIDWRSYSLVVTTHARLQRLGFLNARGAEDGYDPPVPKDVIIFYDDATIDDFMTLFTFPSNIRNIKIAGQLIDVHIPQKDNKLYYIKPESLRFGYGLEKNLTIITTTELLIVEMISQQRPEISIHDELLPSASKLEGGDIHLISTKLVWSKFDGIITLLIERLSRHGFKLEYIANGQGCSTNLCNSKGLNSLSESATIIEISIPAPEETMRLYEQFNGEVEERVINLAIMLDKLHQAVGRNSGYRFRGKPCVVLVDPKYFRAIEKYSRYSFVSTSLPDKENPKEYPRKQPTFKHLEEAMRWYINRLDVYLGDGRKAEYDCIASLRKVRGQQHAIRKKRITTALNNLAKIYPHREKALDKLLANLPET
ncbi:hypothetical protein ACJJID_19440 [Microbulbifer sp. CnH-101-G]|uniref:hypothetical protein n=1 Tax=Microbulbifer sp. CnH-101-G TaxID=3243393 RepID=UPI0040395532